MSTTYLACEPYSLSKRSRNHFFRDHFWSLQGSATEPDPFLPSNSILLLKIHSLIVKGLFFLTIMWKNYRLNWSDTGWGSFSRLTCTTSQASQASFMNSFFGIEENLQNIEMNCAHFNVGLQIFTFLCNLGWSSRKWHVQKGKQTSQFYVEGKCHLWFISWQTLI